MRVRWYGIFYFQNKCFQYWPAEVGQSLQFGPFTIENEFQQCEETFRLSTLSLKCSNDVSWYVEDIVFFSLTSIHIIL